VTGAPSRAPRFGAAGLRVSVSDGQGRPVADGGLAGWLARFAPPAARGEVAVALVSDARMRTLNRRYRRKDHATDVLSFPASGGAPGTPTRTRRPPDSGPRIPDRVEYLGDIVIATSAAKRQARDAGHPYQTELRVLAAHGLLHLLGYDHDDPEDRGRMARAEARLRRKGGLAVGLIERARAGARAPER
jgi:probable rRNA maturation factor